MRRDATLFIIVSIFWGGISAVAQNQEDSPELNELRIVRSLLEQQGRQLNTLQDRILRLQEMIAFLNQRPSALEIQKDAQRSSDAVSASPISPVPTPKSSITAAPAGSELKTSQGQPPQTPSRELTETQSSSSTPPLSGNEPLSDGAPRHIVEKGQTLTSIAKQYGVTISEIQKLNRIEDVRKLQVGQRLAIPTPLLHPGAPATTGGQERKNP
jgi:LysM repeat protein